MLVPLAADNQDLHRISIDVKEALKGHAIQQAEKVMFRMAIPCAHPIHTL